MTSSSSSRASPLKAGENGNGYYDDYGAVDDNHNDDDDDDALLLDTSHRSDTEYFSAHHHHLGDDNSHSSTYYYNDYNSSLSQRLSQRATSIRVSMSRSLRDFVQQGYVPDGSLSVSVRTFEGGATVSSEIANMAKNLIGAGVLSMSGGIALFADDPWAVLPAAVLIGLFGAMLGYYCLIIGKICKWTGAATYRECWQRTMGGERGAALLVSCCIAFNPAMGDLAYAAILSQTFQSLLQTIGFTVTRVESLLVVTVVAILPLCLLKNLYVLAPFSILGTVGVILTAVAMVIRYWDGSYQPGGIYHDDISVQHQPQFGHRLNLVSLQVLPFVCMLFQAYVMHYNSPRFYAELRNPTIPRFTAAVGGSFGLSAFLYIIIACAGFLTFGGNSDSYVLNNYSPYDPLATVCRLAIAFSTLMTYPIVFIGFRDGVLDIFQVPAEKQTSSNINVLTVILLGLITLVACFATDLGVINAFTGGVIATANVFLFPALMFYQAASNEENRINLLRAKNKNYSNNPTLNQSNERFISYKVEAIITLALMVMGVALGLIGTYISLQE